MIWICFPCALKNFDDNMIILHIITLLVLFIHYNFLFCFLLVDRIETENILYDYEFLQKAETKKKKLSLSHKNDVQRSELLCCVIIKTCLCLYDLPFLLFFTFDIDMNLKCFLWITWNTYLCRLILFYSHFDEFISQMYCITKSMEKSSQIILNT